MIKFDLPKDQASIIKVIGVGGGGSNAVSHMYNQGIKGVDFVVCNTDQQALDNCSVPNKFQLGATLTEGLGAGSLPEVGRNAAIESIDEIKAFLQKNTKMVFVTAGMGGGTGTGAAPVIAEAAKELGVLTVGIVTVPFSFEGKKRRLQAEEGVEALRKSVDTLLVINNDRLREMYGNLTLDNAFAQADDVLTTAARGIAEVITVTGKINVDFEDVRTVMKDSGVAIMGSATSEGDQRAIKATENALASPLLNDNDIKGAKYILLNITYGDKSVLMDEISDITDYIQEEAGLTADVIWGHGFDESLGDKIGITVIATGFKSTPTTGIETPKEPEKKYIPLDTAATSEVKEAKVSPAKLETEETEEVEEDIEPYLKAAAPSSDQVSMEFLSNNTETSSSNVQAENEQEDSELPAEEPYLKKKDDQPESAQHSSSPSMTQEQQQQRSEERITKIKELSMKLKTPSGLADLENEPAYKRKNIKLHSIPHSSESQVSKYTLSEREDEEGEGKAEIKRNNPFLHDNVD